MTTYTPPPITNGFDWPTHLTGPSTPIDDDLAHRAMRTLRHYNATDLADMLGVANHTCHTCGAPENQEASA